MKPIKLTIDQNYTLISNSHALGYTSSYAYIYSVFKGKKHITPDGEYEIIFQNDVDATWFLLNL